MNIHLGYIHQGLGDGPCGPNAFQDPESPFLTDGSGNPSTTPHCVLNTYWTNVAQHLGIPPDMSSSLPPGFDPTKPAVPGSRSVADWWNNPGGGGCPMISVNDGLHSSCGGVNPSDGSFIITPCADYRECDSLTGARHYESPLPGGATGNVGFGAPATGPASTPESVLLAYQQISGGKIPSQASLPLQPGQTISPAAKTTLDAAFGIKVPLTQQQLTAATTTPTTKEGTSQTTDTSGTKTPATTPATNFLTESTMFSNVPNWAVLGGAAIVAFLVYQSMEKRR